ncbi:MAG TPA: integrase core domain-containing protein [Thermomicrobiales bacterium]|nr:integrase core domain-containing protein [Thermomicrobiales bacterium]
MPGAPLRGKQSKRNRRRLRQSGLGGGFGVAQRRPRVARQLSQAPELDPAPELRLRCVEYAHAARRAPMPPASPRPSARPPRRPKIKGRVERRNGTVRRECWACDAGALDLPTRPQALRQWETTSPTARLHQALGSQTPCQHLASLAVAHVSN